MFIQQPSSFRFLASLLLALAGNISSANATTLEWDFSQAGDYSATGNANIQSGLAKGTVSNAVNPQITGSWGANASAESLDVVVRGQYAYIARGSLGLSIVDIATPSAPNPVGSYNSNGTAQGIAIQGDYAYIADSGSGLLILNISIPNDPTFVGSLDTAGNASAVAIKDGYAYVADLFSGLHVIDISTPATPLLKTTIPSNGGAQGVAIQGNYAYVADWTGGLQIVDISAPLTAYEIGVSTDSDNAYDVTVRGDYAYVADGSGTFGQFRIFDISNPAMPTLEGADLSLPGNAYDVAVISHYAYVAASDSGLLTFDISSPSNPVLLNEFDSNTAFIDGQGVFPHADEVYIADGTDGLHIVNPNVGLSDVRPVSGSAYNQSLISFEETLGENNVSIIHYQLLKDGTAYYHDETNWVLATNETQTNTASEINQHAASFLAVAGAGALSFKAFFAGDTGDVFELDKVTITTSTLSNCNGDAAVDILDVACEINLAKNTGAPNGNTNIINTINLILAP